MIIPAAMFIEMAKDRLKAQDIRSFAILDELKEFHVASGIEILDMPFPNGTPDVAKGYLLGLETARAILANLPAAVEAGIKL